MFVIIGNNGEIGGIILGISVPNCLLV